jgi:hypothetical protein
VRRSKLRVCRSRALFSESIGSLGRFRSFCGNSRLASWSAGCEFEVDIVAAGAGAGGGSLGVCFVGGAPPMCMQHGVKAAIEGSQGTELSQQYCKLRVRRRCSVIFLYFFAAVVVHQYDCGALRFSWSFLVRLATGKTSKNRIQ